jgi:hypothetical protein
MIKDDERQFWEIMHRRCRKIGHTTGGEKPRDIINGHDFFIEPKRAWYLLEKWAGRGLYDYGTSLDMGWLTEKGIATEEIEDALPPPTPNNESLARLLHFIRGGNGGILGKGIRTYRDRPENRAMHYACLELERRGLIARHKDDRDSVLWMPIEPEPATPKTGPSLPN